MWSAKRYAFDLSFGNVFDIEVSAEFLDHFLKALFYPQMAKIPQIISF
jgi:hypothetical protein